MASKARRRLITDYKKMMKLDNFSIHAEPDENNMLEWYAVILGPDDTDWEGGLFKLSLEFTEEYPNKPPSVKFNTPMYHPNIYNNGKICLDILQKEWTAVYDVSAVLVSIQQLLTDPNPDSPANSEAAKLFVDDREAYNDKVRE
mmetsp:Transcript_6665/g.6227  ORF Transcript_6665/g.6227 Transcript_6665/m.6227 type:complete len:144 (-) Transcript_6665:71-502(-)